VSKTELILLNLNLIEENLTDQLKNLALILFYANKELLFEFQAIDCSKKSASVKFYLLKFELWNAAFSRNVIFCIFYNVRKCFIRVSFSLERS